MPLSPAALQVTRNTRCSLSRCRSHRAAAADPRNHRIAQMAERSGGVHTLLCQRSIWSQQNVCKGLLYTMYSAKCTFVNSTRPTHPRQPAAAAAAPPPGAAPQVKKEVEENLTGASRGYLVDLFPRTHGVNRRLGGRRSNYPVCVKQTGPPHAPPFWPGGVTEDPENLPEPVHRVGGTNRIL